MVLEKVVVNCVCLESLRYLIDFLRPVLQAVNLEAPLLIIISVVVNTD